VATADAYEVGATVDPVQALDFRVAGFGTFVSDEIVFDFANARYVATGSTRRLGVDGGVTVHATDAVRFEGDATYSDGRYTRSGEPIPYAPRLLVVLGAFVEEMPISTALLTAGLRAWGLGPRPLPDGFASHAAFVMDLTAELSFARWMLSLDVDNVLGSRWRDGEFLFASHWDLDEPASELPVRHFTAGAPRALRIAIGRRF
jgi:outer membrane receptor protein involved in Fe transport